MLPFITEYVNRVFPPPAPDATPTLLQKIVDALNTELTLPALFSAAERQKLLYARDTLRRDDWAIKFRDGRRISFVRPDKAQPLPNVAPDDKTI